MPSDEIMEKMRADEAEFRLLVANMLTQLRTEVLEGRADARAVMLSLMMPSVEPGYDSEEDLDRILRPSQTSRVSQPSPEAAAQQPLETGVGGIDVDSGLSP